MQTTATEQLLAWISEGRSFEAQLPDGSLYLRVEDYPPFLCVALHDGEQLRVPLRDACALTAQERRYEEDPHTGSLIASLPMVLVARDSRYEYDLNRAPSQAIYQQAWGKTVWKTPLSDEEKRVSLDKHANFYRLYAALLQRIEKIHGRCLVFDIHSYNAQRLNRDDWPHFNLGTRQVARHRFRGSIDFWLAKLRQIPIDSGAARVAENDVFGGCGYLAGFTREHFRDTLLLATDIAKFYCDEQSGEAYPLVLQALSEQLKSAMVSTVQEFIRRGQRRRISRRELLTNSIDPLVSHVDQEFYRLVHQVDVLDHVNPMNQAEARRSFYRNHFRVDPQFHYRPILLEPFKVKEMLYRLPVDKISDITLQRLYRDVIDSYADKVEQLASIGSEKFLYNSLRYYGEPSDRDTANARFLLHAPALPEEDQLPSLNAEQIRQAFLSALQQMGMPGRVKLSRKIVATAMVSASQRMVLIKATARVTPTQLQALIHHELGVHLTTTRNAEPQPLKIFQLGTPLNTLTQEGLAILAEYLSGNITLQRLKILALRVLVIKRMVNGDTFRDVFAMLVEEYHLSDDAAFTLTMRAFRGGGFTKDYLYLRGIRDCLRAYQAHVPLEVLFIGKTSLEYLPILNELRERQLISAPRFLPPAFQSPQPSNQVIDYIMQAIT
jgi:uncharacterized protein (TIGR02421 family)